MSKWIRKGDKVVVVAGNDKGKRGEIVKKKGDSFIVSGINLRKKHMKSRQQGQSSQILEIECPIHCSNICLCNAEGKPIKIKIKLHEDGRKELVYKESGKEKVHRLVKKAKGK